MAIAAALYDFRPHYGVTARMNPKIASARTAAAVAMKTPPVAPRSAAGGARPRSALCPVLAAFALLVSGSSAHASLFQGETLDSIANGISWVVLVIAPVIGVVVFWLVHILPEKIAEKRRHPQAKAIQCLCLLSLCFGGLLWPFAWLWAYTKPVLHKMAYGTDVDESHGHHGGEVKELNEVERLQARVAELEAKLSAAGNKA